MKRILVLLLAAAMLLGMAACGHEHTWVEATCTEPRTCSGCGETEGEPLGHTWTDATCTQPRTCSVCGETEGEPLGHTWTDATCTQPRTCSVCGETEGEPLGHAGSWQVKKEATLLKGGEEEQVCSRCGEVLDTRKTDPKTIRYKNGVFNFTSDEFVALFQDSMNSNMIVSDTKDIDPLGGHAYGIYKSGEVLGFLSFKENSSGQVTEIMVWGDTEEALFVGIYTFTVVCGIDATSQSDQIFDSLSKTSSCTLNGFKLSFVDEGGGYFSFHIVGA